MENMSFLFSMLFFVFFIIYLFAGLYVFFNAPKKPINQISFSLLIALSFWTFGFMIAISAPNYQICLFWRRFSALGWGTFFAILLHFSLLFTENKKFAKYKWLHLTIYLPAIIVVFAFAISHDLTQTLYVLVNTECGWTNVAKNSGWDIFHMIYYVSYSLISMILIFRWARNKNDALTKQRANVIIGSYLLVFILATITDSLSNAYLGMKIPQMAPIFMIVPIFIMFYNKRYFNMIISKSVEQENGIINAISIKKVYFYLSIAMIFGGILNFYTQFMLSSETKLTDVLFLTGLLIVVGIAIQILQRINILEKYRDYIIVCLLALLIPIVTLQFAEYGGVTVWAFPFVIIIAFLVFRERILLGIISISIISTQIVVWIVTPETYASVNGSDYILRISFFCIAICLCYYINNLFLIRMNETNKKMKLQTLVTQISSVCVGINQQNFEENIDYLLITSGEFFRVDRAYICLFDLENQTNSCIQEYCRPGCLAIQDLIQNIPINPHSRRMKKVLANEPFVVSDITILPEFINGELLMVENCLLKSQIIAPITSKEKVIGFWGLDTEVNIIDWQDDHLNFMKLIANILGDTLTRIDAEKELNFMAHYDDVTKLPNRNLFTNYVYFNIVKQEFSDKILGVVFLDLDSFKTVNDTVGHGMGDELLYLVGEKLKNMLKKNDLVSRFSGDEFLIMITDLSSEEDVVQVAERLMHLFYEPFILKGQEFFMTASAGIALYPMDGKDPETLIMNADIAKFKAKENGRNQYLLCSSDLKGEVNRQNQLTNFLYRALEKGELFIEYQPQVHLVSGKITGVESLLRWRHPELGLISPGIIIPLAEQTSLINPIGEWVLETACQQNKKWQDMGLKPILMAVNISASQFKNPHFINQVENVLQKTGLKPEYLEVEITESMAILEFSEIIRKLNGLKSIGVSIAIDDFGTEYSSLGRLKMLPLDRLKMDKQFIDGIGYNHKDQAIANAIIQLGKSLGLSVVAEGVEDEDQMAFLKTSQCDLIQGYFYYKPLNALAIEEILKKQDE